MLRERLGLSQAQLAAAVTDAGVTGWFPQTVTKVEQGVRSVKLVEGLALAQCLGVEPVELYEGTMNGVDQQVRRLSFHLRTASEAVARDLQALMDLEGELGSLMGVASPRVAQQAEDARATAGAHATSKRIAQTVEKWQRRYDPDPDEGPDIWDSNHEWN